MKKLKSIAVVFAAVAVMFAFAGMNNLTAGVDGDEGGCRSENVSLKCQYSGSGGHNCQGPGSDCEKAEN